MIRTHEAQVSDNSPNDSDCTYRKIQAYLPSRLIAGIIFLLNLSSVNVASALGYAPILNSEAFKHFDEMENSMRIAETFDADVEVCGHLYGPGACTEELRKFIVLQYQMQLLHHCPSFPKELVTGEESGQSDKALKQFQKAYGLIPDGLHGPDTAKALGGPVNQRCDQK